MDEQERTTAEWWRHADPETARVEAERWQHRNALRKAKLTPVSPRYDLVFGPGFRPDQEQRRWMGSDGTLHFSFDELPRKVRLDFECGPAEHYEVFPFQLRLEVDGQPCQSVRFRKSHQNRSLTFRPKGRCATLRLRSETAFVPAQIGLSRDTRPLSVRLENIAVTPGRKGTSGSVAASDSQGQSKSETTETGSTGHAAAQRDATTSDPVPARLPIESAAPGNPAAQWASFARLTFSAFLAADARLRLPACRDPRVSVLLVLYGRCELTYLCLQSLIATCHIPYEVILVDNASGDETPQLLDRVEHAKIARNSQNVGFVAAVNQAASMAGGEHLLLLNNDTQLVGDTVAMAADVLDTDATAGAVGGRIVSPDGTLQEAGSVICSDGSTVPCGAGQSPLEPAYMVPRDVDFCTGAFLMTRKSEFDALQGLDEDFSPGYFEEVDYCTRLAKRGRRVVCDPRVLLMHYGSASATKAHVKELIRGNRLKFYRKHEAWLQQRHKSRDEILWSQQPNGAAVVAATRP